MNWFSWRDRVTESLGLDINSTDITLFYLTRTHTQCQMRQAICVPIKQDKFQSLESATVEAIKTGVGQLKTTHRKVNIAISDVKALSRTFNLDISNANWKKVALLRMASDIPVPLDKVYLDFEAQKFFDQSDNAKVLGIACPQNIVDQRLQIIKSTGLNPHIVELESHAIERTLYYLKLIRNNSKLSACIYMTLDTITILLWFKQTVIAVSSNRLTQTSHSLAVAQQVQQALAQLLFTSTIQPLQVCYIASSHPLRFEIAALCRHSLGINLFSFRLKPVKNNATNLSVLHNLVAFGLALRA